MSKTPKPSKAAKKPLVKKARPVYLKISSSAENPIALVWLIMRDGPAHSGLLFGRILADVAEEMASQLGIPVVREEQPKLEVPDDKVRRTKRR